MNDIPDHPDVHNCELTGYPNGKESDYPHCPICGAECESIFTDKKSVIVGCDMCLIVNDAWEVPDCFPNE